MKAIQIWFTKVVIYLENNETPFRRYVFLFFAILFVRLGLEFFSNSRLFRLEDILHIGLWFMFIVSAFLVQLHLFSGESITKVFKVVVVCFSIALSAPIIDLVVSNGMGVKMNYLSINSAKDIIFSYFTIGGVSLMRGATLGIRIEIIILLIASFNYIYYKTNKLLRTILATLCIYTVLFFSGTLPFLIMKLTSVLNLKFEVGDSSSILVLLLLNVITISVIIYSKYKQSFHVLLKKINWIELATTCLLFISGGLSAIKNYPDNWQLNSTTLFCLPLLIVLCVLFVIYHRYLKSKLDSEIKLHYYVENAIFILVSCISLAISSSVLFVSILLWAILFLLYEAPLQLYKVKFLGNLLGSFKVVTLLLLGFVFFNAPMVGFPKVWIALIIWVVFSSELLVSNLFAQKKWNWLMLGLMMGLNFIFCLQNFEFLVGVIICLTLLIHYTLLLVLNDKYENLKKLSYFILSSLMMYYLTNTFIV
jgi:hypothetical protein